METDMVNYSEPFVRREEIRKKLETEIMAGASPTDLTIEKLQYAIKIDDSSTSLVSDGATCAYCAFTTVIADAVFDLDLLTGCKACPIWEVTGGPCYQFLRKQLGTTAPGVEKLLSVVIEHQDELKAAEETIKDRYK